MGRTSFKRLAIILENNFISLFSSDIGRKFAGESVAFPGLGIVVIIACNISGGGAVLSIIGWHTVRR